MIEDNLFDGLVGNINQFTELTEDLKNTLITKNSIAILMPYCKKRSIIIDGSIRSRMCGIAGI